MSICRLAITSLTLWILLSCLMIDIPDYFGFTDVVFGYQRMVSCKEYTAESYHENKIQDIVGGKDCQITECPFFVQVRTKTRHLCGGSLLNARWILTAAHCFAFVPETEEIYVVAGITWRNFIDTSTAQIAKVEKYILHPRYNKSDILTMDDIAVGQLQEKINETESVQFASLPEVTSNNDSGPEYPVCKEGIVVGFGEQDIKLQLLPLIIVFKGNYTPHLQCVVLEVLPPEHCLLHFAIIFYPAQFCAMGKYYGQDACQGDSGGPFQCEHKLLGIVSRGIGCGMPRVASVYMSVQYYNDFIVNYTKEEEKEMSKALRFNLDLYISLVILLINLMYIKVQI